MIEILKNYCNAQNGLLLFDPPTGSGKTYSVLKWIFENYKTHCREGRKIFFITNLKKNLPIEDLKTQHFQANGKLADFNKHVLFLDANTGFVLENLDSIKNEIPEYFKKQQAYKNLKSQVRLVNNLRATNKFKDVLKTAENELRNKHEREFRRRIELYLKEHYPNKRERLKAIKTNDDLKWIGKLYPSVFSSEKKIFFLSIDKFYAQNSTLVEPSYHFINHEITKEAIVFIDEVDATKDNILNNIIEKGKRQRIDYIHLFNEIYWALSSNSLPQDFLEHSIERDKLIAEGYKYLPLNNIESILKSKAEEIVSKYKVSYSFKTTDAVNISRERNLLFHDFQYHAVYRNNHKYIEIDTDQTKKMNLLRFRDDKPLDNQLNVITLLNQIKGYVSYFQGAIKSIAQNYQETIKERRASSSLSSEFSYDLALSTVLEEFRLEGKYKTFIMDSILSERERKNRLNKDEPKLQFDFSVYENGFRYYDFIDDEQHETITKTFIYNFNTTPEKFLLRLAERAKVIGISATAKIETVTGNYDIGYLKKQLGDNFLELTGDEKSQLKDFIDKQNENYKDVNIHPIWIQNRKSESEVFNGFADLFGSKELAKHIIGHIDNPTFFHQNRYLRIAKAFDHFLKHADINAMLCLLNKEPKQWDDKLRSTTLEEIFDILIEKYDLQQNFISTDEDGNDKYNVKNAYRIINSADFETKKEDFTEQLERGQKLFLISMYQTVGAGQNLQYASPNVDELIDIRSEDLPKYNFEKTDINAIYLDKPTHLIQLINKQLDEEGFIRYLFQLEFLLEAGRISLLTLKKEVSRAFENLMASLNSNPIPNKSGFSLYKDYNIKQHYSKFVIQAIGRICRTNLKAKNIYIIADDELKNQIADFDLSKSIVLKEFQALVNSCNTTSIKRDAVDVHCNKAVIANRKTLSRINRYINRDYEWRQKEIDDWQELRKICLMYPTITQKKSKDMIRILDVFVELPKVCNSLSYEEENDFQSIKIDFGQKFAPKVSEESARLQELLSIPGVQPYFEAKSYATSFEEGKYILTPVLFHNIYKGALGEEVGLYIFERELNIPLEELPREHFELFDYRIKGTNVYVDFKHWQEYTQLDAETMQHKIRNKSEKVEASKVLIVNILATQNYKSITTSDGKIIEIGNLFDYENKEYNQQAINTIQRIYAESFD